MIIMVFFYRTTASIKVQEKKNFFKMSRYLKYHFLLIVQCAAPQFIYCTLFKLCPENRHSFSHSIFL